MHTHMSTIRGTIPYIPNLTKFNNASMSFPLHSQSEQSHVQPDYHAPTKKETR